jgi:pyruvate/2-oxoacid:ferredoxin oxidoreductase alpha subunit
VKASLYNANIPIYSVIGGIGGKELGKNEIIGVVEKLLSGKLESEVWLL